MLESRVFQLENTNDNKNNSTDRLNSSSESMIENRSPTGQQAQLPQSEMPVKRTFGDHLTFHKKAAGRNLSPSMLVKASSIAGLSPLLKRTKSAELHKLSPINNDEKSDTFSILKKPRLIQQNSKKSELRPIRLNKGSALSTVDEKQASNGGDAQSTNRNFASIKTSSFNNKFRLGGLSKPN